MDHHAASLLLGWEEEEDMDEVEPTTIRDLAKEDRLGSKHCSFCDSGAVSAFDATGPAVHALDLMPLSFMTLEKKGLKRLSSGSMSKKSSSSKEILFTSNKFKSMKGKEKNLPKRKPLKICRVKERTRRGVVAAKKSSSSKEILFTSNKFKSMKGKEKNLPKRKPLKICRVKERTRRGVVAATIEELRTKIQTQFPSIGDDFKIILEEDCTRIEDEDYFKTLPDNTVLVVVSKDEQWTGASSSLEEEFSMGHVEVDGQMTQEETSQRLVLVAGSIAENPAVLAFLPKVDLEIMADADLNELQVLLHQTKDKAEFIQDACERRLTDMIASDEARELLKLYHRAKTEEVGSPSPSKTEEDRSLLKKEGRSLSKTREVGSISKTKEGGSLSKMAGRSLLKTKKGRSLLKTVEGRYPKRVTRSTRKESKETS